MTLCCKRLASLPGLVVLAVLLAGCALIPSGQGDTASKTLPTNLYSEEQPISPLPDEKVRVYMPKSNTMEDVYWASLSNATKLDLLPLHTDHVAVYNRELGGKISFATASTSAKGSAYLVVFDFLKSRVERVYNNKNEFIGMGHVGVGVRVKARITTSEAGVDLGSLAGLGLAASTKKVTGELLVQAIGIDSPSISDLMPFTSDISPASIQATMQALAAVKSKLWEKNTTITPHLVSVALETPIPGAEGEYPSKTGPTIAPTKANTQKESQDSSGRGIKLSSQPSKVQ